MDEHASFEPQAVLAPRRRRGSLAGVVVATLALVGTIAAGVAGTAGNRPAPTHAAPFLEAIASPAVTEEPAAVTSAPLPRFPGRVLGLQVWSAAYVSTYGLNYFGGTFAVAGWYSPQPRTDCPTDEPADPGLEDEFGVATDTATFCRRGGSLFTAPMFDEHVAPITIELRPGAAVPAYLNDTGVVTSVVFIGTLRNPGMLCHTPNACQLTMVVDRVTWAAGMGLTQTSSVLPRLLDRWPPLGSQQRDELSVRGIGYRGDVLLETLVDLDTLETIDAHAAEILGAAAPKPDRIWYRRVLGLDPEADPIRWVGIDDDTGRLIASGMGT
jgi:hypothetical protein